MLRKLSIVAAGAVFADQPGAEPFAVLLIACLWLLVQMRARPYRFPVSVVTRDSLACLTWCSMFKSF